MGVYKTKTWADNWNDVIRTVIFPDKPLKALMKVDSDDSKDIVRFITKHFIEKALPDEPVIDQEVLVYYNDTEGTNFGATPYVRQRYVEFDIYVRRDQ